MTLQDNDEQHKWLEAIATVTSCKYEFGAGQAIAFGVPSDKHFHITFNYWANHELHTGEYSSATAVPQGTLFPVTYNPVAPHEHNHSYSGSPKRSSLLAIGIVGSVVLSLIWFAIVRGCGQGR